MNVRTEVAFVPLYICVYLKEKNEFTFSNFLTIKRPELDLSNSG